MVSVISKPRIDVTTIMPTRKNEMCWDQNCTSKSILKYLTVISIDLVTGSTLPTLSNMMFIEDLKHNLVWFKTINQRESALRCKFSIRSKWKKSGRQNWNIFLVAFWRIRFVPWSCSNRPALEKVVEPFLLVRRPLF